MPVAYSNAVSNPQRQRVEDRMGGEAGRESVEKFRCFVLLKIRNGHDNPTRIAPNGSLQGEPRNVLRPGSFKALAVEAAMFCLAGGFCGAGVGFFLFLRLGWPKPPELAGVVSGLVVISGLKLGLTIFGVRRLMSWLMR